MDSDSWKVAHGMLADCCHALFETLGLTLSEADDSGPYPTEERLTTFIGFSGNDLRGSITMDLSIDLVALKHPATLSGLRVDRAQLCDWAGELANQLLGRFKNTIARQGVMLQMSTPSTVSGRMSRAPRTVTEGSLVLNFASGDDRLFVHFDAVPLVPLDLTKPVALSSEGEPQAEGEAMLF